MDLDDGDRVAAIVQESGRIGEGSNKPDSTKQRKQKMKKLMIAAVAAVVAGSMFAAPYVYDFDATVKTTQGRAGVVTVNLGMNAAGTQFWYQDPAVAGFMDTTKNINGVAVPTIKAETVNGNPAIQAAILTIAATYNTRSAGRWCETYRIPGCYRVAGTRRYTDQFRQDDCCAAGYALNDVDGNGSVIAWQQTSAAIATPLFQRFGSADPAAANKVELYGPVSIFTVGAVQVFGGWLAGQGTMARRNGVDYISTISGNIVGTLPAPTCANCCTLPTPSVAFDCANPTGAALPFTAGFGTFRLRINNNLTTF